MGDRWRWGGRHVAEAEMQSGEKQGRQNRDLEERDLRVTKKEREEG
jgi:hypothetical protein